MLRLSTRLVLLSITPTSLRDTIVIQEEAQAWIGLVSRAGHIGQASDAYLVIGNVNLPFSQSIYHTIFTSSS